MEAKTKAAQLIGLEIQKESAQMARRSVALNDLQDKIQIVDGDIKEAGQLFDAASFDVITCNPPYMISQHGLHAFLQQYARGWKACPRVVRRI